MGLSGGLRNTQQVKEISYLDKMDEIILNMKKKRVDLDKRFK